MVMLINGKLVDVVRMWRVEVESKREMEIVQYYAKLHDRKFKKGATSGEPGKRHMICYMEVDRYELREKVQDTLSRLIGHDVSVRMEMETLSVR